MKEHKPYYKFSEYLKEHFACRVYKVSVDAGFSCPNRDGKIDTAGCIYCDNQGFSFNTRIPPRPIEEQIEEGIEIGKRRFKADKFIVYFQAYTNTYASVSKLKRAYDSIKNFEDIVGLSIGTRPDCVNDEILNLIAGYTSDYEVWVEYGLQSIHDKTLKFINRGHVYEDFLKAVEKTKKMSKIKICAHVILGLPDETKEDAVKTARELGRLKIEGVKIHPLHIIKNTQLEELFQKGRYKPLNQKEYINLAMEFLGYLHPQTIIQRIGADCPQEFLVEPSWILEKNKVLQNLDKALLSKNRFQGQFFKT